MEEIRADVPPDVPILIPGVGAQGGDLDASVRANVEAGSRAFIISVSRGNHGAAHGDDLTAGMRAAAQEFDAPDPARRSLNPERYGTLWPSDARRPQTSLVVRLGPFSLLNERSI